MKILITGANGFLGQQLILQLLADTGHTIIATGRGPNRLNWVDQRLQYFPLDITDGTAATAFYETEKPGCIIHAAAMTQADQAETQKVDCWNANVTATRFLLEAAKSFQPYIIYASTDFVFSGEAGPYNEAAATGPVNYYGSSKLAAEHAVLEAFPNAGVVRTCLVYGKNRGQRGTILDWILRNLKEGKAINVVNDQWRTPTYVNELAKGILLMMGKKAAGIYHLSGEALMTPYEMALSIAKYYELDETLITPTSSALLNEIAMRPQRTGFIIDKAKRELGFEHCSFAEALSLIRNE